MLQAEELPTEMEQYHQLANTDAIAQLQMKHKEQAYACHELAGTSAQLEQPAPHPVRQLVLVEK